jgi:hypothetical protein
MNGPQQRLDAWAGRSAPSRLGACETPVACEQPASAPARAAPQVNKMDDPSITGPDGAWSQERYNEICTGLTPFLKACGYNPKKDIVFLPMSGLLGHNLRDAVPPGVCPWYKARRGLLPAAPSFARGPPLPAALHDQRWQGPQKASMSALPQPCCRRRRRARAVACRCRRPPCRLRKHARARATRVRERLASARGARGGQSDPCCACASAGGARARAGPWGRALVGGL